jgi:hypothetical protein
MDEITDDLLPANIFGEFSSQILDAIALVFNLFFDVSQVL